MKKPLCLYSSKSNFFLEITTKKKDTSGLFNSTLWVDFYLFVVISFYLRLSTRNPTMIIGSFGKKTDFFFFFFFFPPIFLLFEISGPAFHSPRVTQRVFYRRRVCVKELYDVTKNRSSERDKMIRSVVTWRRGKKLEFFPLQEWFLISSPHLK